MKTILESDGKLFHKACLNVDEWFDSTTVAAEKVDEEAICEECAGTLLGEDSPDDPTSDDPTPEDSQQAS